MWQMVDDNYSFFDRKKVDWSEVRQRYQPQIEPGMSERQLFEVLSRMLLELRDRHVSLHAPFDRSAYDALILDVPDQFDWELLRRGVLRQVHRAQQLGYQKLGLLGYLRIDDFAGGFDDADLDTAMAFLADATGLIVDVRKNPGGSLLLMEQVVSRWTPEEMQYALFRAKTGKAHDNFGNWHPQKITPHHRGMFSGPVVVLVDQGCYSACNLFALANRYLPHVKLVGVRTGGGGATAVGKDLPNGWQLRVSASQFVAADGSDIEAGIEPTETVMLREEDRSAGRDTILERAVAVLSAPP